LDIKNENNRIIKKDKNKQNNYYPNDTNTIKKYHFREKKEDNSIHINHDLLNLVNIVNILNIPNFVNIVNIVNLLTNTIIDDIHSKKIKKNLKN